MVWKIVFGLWQRLPGPARFGVVAAVVLAIAGSYAATYYKGRSDGTTAGLVDCANARAEAEKERASNAERQRDIANAPPASLDAVLEWLSGE